MRKRPVIASILAFGGFLCLYVLSHSAIVDHRAGFGANYSMAVSPVPPSVAKIIAGEFRGLAADYLLLEVGAFIGGNRVLGERDWKTISQALEQALALDPYFEQTYIYVQGNLPWQGKMPEKANALLDISRKHRTWDWRPGYYMGFNDYFFMNDFEAASNRFLETAKIKNAPVLLAVLGGRLAMKAGSTEAGISVLNSMLEDPELDDYYKKEISDRITALEAVITLERAVDEYKQHYGRLPADLDILVKEGILPDIPPNPYQRPYFYESANGRVFFDKIK